MDLMINRAGVGVAGNVVEQTQPRPDNERQRQRGVFGCKYGMQHMLTRRRRSMINIACVAGMAAPGLRRLQRLPRGHYRPDERRRPPTTESTAYG